MGSVLQIIERVYSNYGKYESKHIRKVSLTFLRCLVFFVVVVGSGGGGFYVDCLFPVHFYSTLPRQHA